MLRLIGSISLVACLAACTQPDAAQQRVDRATRTDWPTYGQDKGGQRYSTLREIDVDNVDRLQVAWEYHMRPEAAAADSAADDRAAPRRPGSDRTAPNTYRASQVTPLVIDGIMYLGTPYGAVVALDATTGAESWVYALPDGVMPSRRGLEYWPGDDSVPPTIFVGTQNGLLIALDMQTGRPRTSFATAGMLDLKTDDVVDTSPEMGFGRGYALSSPPLAVDGLIITAAANGESPPRGARGDVRAWDARTGELVWQFAPVPAAGEFGHDTWARGSAEWRRGVAVWGFMTADLERRILYLPFGAPAWDRYGGDRAGQNLFSSTLVAVDLDTGERLWHFQAVHHDIWDYDLSAPPALLDVHNDGRTIPAVAISSKMGLLFILDRATGEPVFGIEERPVPTSNAPGEETWPTQPFPVKPEPLARNAFSLEDLATVTPELTAYCREWISEHDMKFGGPYFPIGYQQTTVLFPGFLGGSNWHGASFNPDTRLLYANVTNMGQVYLLTDSKEGPLPVTGGPLSSRFYQEETRLMCQEPPWGELLAVNVDTGEIAWRSVLGVSDNVPEDRQATGRPNIGGTITTAGGLVFVGATDDARFRAFDAQSGELLWQTRLPAAAHATPITYLGADGRQYVVISATGGSFLRSPLTGDSVIAWALPEAG